METPIQMFGNLVCEVGLVIWKWLRGTKTGRKTRGGRRGR
jgi:hypothetical protein